MKNDEKEDQNISASEVRHVYIIGSKSIGLYGGYESFVLNLLKQHKDQKGIQYHIACKANGQGYMDLRKLPGAEKISDTEFSYFGAHGFLIPVPSKIGAAQAIYYDLAAFRYVCRHIESHSIKNPIVYILASRIGPFEKPYVKRAHRAGGLVFQNPDGHEDWRRKWPLPVRKYWKFSERCAVKNADLTVCDSKNIEKYIREEYAAFSPKTVFIAYGSYVRPALLSEDAPEYCSWLSEHGLRDREFYISVGRFVEENNFETMIREFMKSKTKKDFAVITTEDSAFAEKLQKKLGYRNDPRIKFVGTVYQQELLSRIRTNAYGYLHGHEVGGTNPSLLESLGSTDLNLLYGVGFNREVAEDSAFYWDKTEGNLAKLIDDLEALSEEERREIGSKAKERIRREYSWEKICSQYEEIFLRGIGE